MKMKPAILTILVLNVMGFSAWYGLKFLYWQALWIGHSTGLGHKCPQEHLAMAVVLVVAEILLGILVYVLYLTYEEWVDTFFKSPIKSLYRRIDRFLERKRS